MGKRSFGQEAPLQIKGRYALLAFHSEGRHNEHNVWARPVEDVPIGAPRPQRIGGFLQEFLQRPFWNPLGSSAVQPNAYFLAAVSEQGRLLDFWTFPEQPDPEQSDKRASTPSRKGPTNRNILQWHRSQ